MSGRPFELGNKMGKGRPPGSRNKKTIFQEALEKHGVAIINQCLAMALKGNIVALRLCIERLVPLCTAPGNHFRLGPVRTAADLVKALPRVMQEVARGHLSAQEGEALGRTMESHRRNLDGEEYYARLRAVEQRLSERSGDDESTILETGKVENNDKEELDGKEEELDGKRVAPIVTDSGATAQGNSPATCASPDKEEQTMRKDLIRRLEKLEANHEGFRIVSVVLETETPETKRALAPNERRVEDWYVESGDAIYEIKQRITVDPSDSGRNYLRDATGHESEDPSLKREITRGGDIIAVVRNATLRSPSSPPSGRDAGTNGSLVHRGECKEDLVDSYR